MKSGSTELVFIIDRSGSMSGLEDDTIGGYNTMLKEQQSVEGETVVTTVLFADQYELLHDRINIQAIAEAGKIGIAADRAQNYHADASGTQSAYTAMSAMSTAFRTGGSLSYTQSKDAQSQAGRDAFLHLKEVLGGLKKSTDELVGEFTDLIGVAQATGGKIPDVNEILRQVLSERDKEGKK